MDETDWTPAEKFSWTPENVEKLKKLWNDGYSASKCAGMIGGCTRNSIVGKVHRLGLAGRVTAQRQSVNADRYKHAAAMVRRNAARQARVRPPEVEAQPMPEIEFEDRPGVAILDLEPHHCRWPLGELMQRSTEFCGHPHQPGSPYCPNHHHMAHTKVQAIDSRPHVSQRWREKTGRVQARMYERVA